MLWYACEKLKHDSCSGKKQLGSCVSHDAGFNSWSQAGFASCWNVQTVLHLSCILESQAARRTEIEPVRHGRERLLGYWNLVRCCQVIPTTYTRSRLEIRTSEIIFCCSLKIRLSCFPNQLGLYMLI